jgi:hypothetical protein
MTIAANHRDVRKLCLVGLSEFRDRDHMMCLNVPLPSLAINGSEIESAYPAVEPPVSLCLSLRIVDKFPAAFIITM